MRETLAAMETMARTAASISTFALSQSGRPICRRCAFCRPGGGEGTVDGVIHGKGGQVA